MAQAVVDGTCFGRPQLPMKREPCWGWGRVRCNVCARTAFTALVGSSGSNIKSVKFKLIKHQCRVQDGAADQQNAGLLRNVVST